MESLSFLMILFAILLLVLLAAAGLMVWWLVSQLRSQTEATIESLTALAEMQQNLFSEATEAAQTQTKTSLEFLSKEHDKQTASMERAQERVMSGASSTTTAVLKLVTETTTLLATKDPIAYQQVMGGNIAAAASPGATSPEGSYTSIEDNDELQSYQEAERRAQEAMDSLLSLGGVTRDEYSGTPEFAFPTVE